MSDQMDTNMNGQSLDGSDMPPPQDEMRAKKVKKSNRLVLGGFAVISCILGYYLIFAGAGDSSKPSVPSQGGQATPGSEQGPGFITDKNHAVATQGARQDSNEGGMGRERADVLSEIDERETLLSRMASGETTVIFEEVDFVEVNDEDLEDYQAETPVFGDVAPRERPSPSPSTVAANQNSAMTNTPPAIRPQPQVNPQPQVGSYTINPEAVAYELALLEGQRGASGGGSIQYTSYDPTQRHASLQSNVDHPMTPSVNESALHGRNNSGTDVRDRAVNGLRQGELAMPGDMTVAYLSTRISSDQPGGRARAEILEGPLRGGVLLGAPQFQGERLLINFNQVRYEDFVYDIEALAVDVTTLETSVQDGIDRRLLTRYGVPILAGIASIGIDYQAERSNPSVTQTNEFTGETISRRTNDTGSFGQYAMQESTSSLKRPLSDIASNAANTPVHVWADPGAIGVLFVSSIPSASM